MILPLVVSLLSGIAGAQTDTLVFKDGREITGTFIGRRGAAIWFRHRENSLESERFYNEAEVERIELGAAVEPAASESDGDAKRVDATSEPGIGRYAASATAVTVQRLAAFHNHETREALLEIQADSKSRAVRRAASEALVSIFEGAQSDEVCDQICSRITQISTSSENSDELRTRAMRSLIDRFLESPASNLGVEVLDLAASEAGEGDSNARLAQAVVAEIVAQRPEDIHRFLTANHEVIRRAAASQAEVWQRLDPRLPFEDVIRLVQWRQQRLGSLYDYVDREQGYLDDNPKRKKTTDRAIWESHSSNVGRLREQIEEIERAPILSFATDWVLSYYNAMYQIATGEQRAEDRVSRASKPRGRYEIFFENTDRQYYRDGTYDEYVVGESSIVIDLDAILGPKPEPTDDQLDALRKPDVAHARALRWASESVEQLYHLSPQTVKLALDLFQTQYGISDQNMVSLPPRP